MKGRLYKLVLILMAIGLAVYYFYPEQSLPSGIVVDDLRVHKSKHLMEAYSSGQRVKTYKISIGRGEWGMHDREPNLTPTGNYTVSKLPTSSFHKALPISYGNLIEIHGLRNGLGFIGKFQRWVDWTRGCIAVTNAEIDELYASVKEGSTTIEIEA